MMLDWSRSSRAQMRARKVMPGGNTRSSAFEAPHAIYFAAGKGAYVSDIDGHRYLDFQNNFTTLIHGHAHEETVVAVKDQISKGVCFSNPTLSEIELAEILCDRVGHFEQVRFMNTGSEAVMMAIKAARAITGRQLIAKCEGAYHGSYDYVEMSVEQPPVSFDDGVQYGQPSHNGTASHAARDVIVIPFNNVGTTHAILDQVKGRLAAVIFDPMPSRAGLVPVSAAYLKLLRNFTTNDGSLLISDEVLNFRRGYGGALEHADASPDLTAFGKIVGGGLPIGAVAGSADVMAVFDPYKGPQVGHAGTFTANPVSMVAGAAALKAMTPAAFDQLNALGETARRALTQVLRDSRRIGVVTGAGSLFRIFLGRDRVNGYAEAFGTQEQRQALARAVDRMRQQGVLLSKIGLGAISTPMTASDISRLQEVFRDALDPPDPAVED